MGIQRWRHRYVIRGFKDGDIGMSYGWIKDDGDMGMSHGGIKDGDLDMLYGDSKMATYVCCIGIQRWRHRYVI